MCFQFPDAEYQIFFKTKNIFGCSGSRDGLPGQLRQHDRGDLLPADLPSDQLPHRHQHVHCGHPRELQPGHRGRHGQ